MLKEVEERINIYLNRLEDADKKEAILLKTTKKELQEHIQNLQKYKASLEKIDAKLEKSGEVIMGQMFVTMSKWLSMISIN
jgi:hypothetical protein